MFIVKCVGRWKTSDNKKCDQKYGKTSVQVHLEKQIIFEEIVECGGSRLVEVSE